MNNNLYNRSLLTFFLLCDLPVIIVTVCLRLCIERPEVHYESVVILTDKIIE